MRVPGDPGAFPTGSDIKDAAGAAKAMEAIFLRRLLAEVRPAKDGLMDGGFAGETFREMLEGTLADIMAEAGGVGLATQIAAQIDPGAQAGATPRASGPASPGTAPLADPDAAPPVRRDPSLEPPEAPPGPGSRSLDPEAAPPIRRSPELTLSDGEREAATSAHARRAIERYRTIGG